MTPWTDEQHQSLNLWLVGADSRQSALTDLNTTANVFVTSVFVAVTQVWSTLVSFFPLLVLSMFKKGLTALLWPKEVYKWSNQVAHYMWLRHQKTKRLFLKPLRSFHNGMNYFLSVILCFYKFGDRDEISSTLSNMCWMFKPSSQFNSAFPDSSESACCTCLYVQWGWTACGFSCAYSPKRHQSISFTLTVMLGGWYVKISTSEWNYDWNAARVPKVLRQSKLCFLVLVPTAECWSFTVRHQTAVFTYIFHVLIENLILKHTSIICDNANSLVYPGTISGYICVMWKLEASIARTLRMD